MNNRRLKKFDILLVEDNPADVRLVEIYLSEKSDSYEFDLTNTPTLTQAFEILNTKTFDLVFLDLSLPDSLGLETLEKLLNNFPDAAVVVLTGLGDIKKGVEAVRLGAYDFLIKGDINENILLKTILYANERKTNLQLKKDNELAKKTAQLKQQFLANMSHELRTPLNVVIGATKLLEQSTPTREQLKFLNALKISSTSLLRLINNILDFSKLESGKISLEKRTFDLLELLQELSEVYQIKAKEKNLQFLMTISAVCPRFIQSDSLRLNQILTNLLENAIKYTQQGKVELIINVLNEDSVSAMLEFIIKDTGIGIAPEKQEVIFESFTQANLSTTRLYGGTGLGLSIAKELSQALGGTMQLKSKINEGSTFSFTTNFDKDIQIGTTTIIEKEPQAALNTNNHQTIKILLVEDHHLNQLIVTELLKKWETKNQVKIEIAENGQIAVDKVKNNDYDIILMDISMPVMDGHKATTIIKNELPSKKQEIPIIALTAHALKEEIEKCYKAGMDDFISKPIDAETLYNKLNFISSHLKKDKIQEDKLELNLEYINHLANDNLPLKISLIESILDDLPKEIIKLKAAYRNNDVIEYYKIAHKLKSTLSYIGINEHKNVKPFIYPPVVKNNFPFKQNTLPLFYDICSESINILTLLLLELKKPIYENIDS